MQFWVSINNVFYFPLIFTPSCNKTIFARLVARARSHRGPWLAEARLSLLLIGWPWAGEKLRWRWVAGRRSAVTASPPRPATANTEHTAASVPHFWHYQYARHVIRRCLFSGSKAVPLAHLQFIVLSVCENGRIVHKTFFNRCFI